MDVILVLSFGILIAFIIFYITTKIKLVKKEITYCDKITYIEKQLDRMQTYIMLLTLPLLFLIMSLHILINKISLFFNLTTTVEIFIYSVIVNLVIFYMVFLILKAISISKKKSIYHLQISKLEKDYGRISIDKAEFVNGMLEMIKKKEIKLKYVENRFVSDIFSYMYSPIIVIIISIIFFTIFLFSGIFGMLLLFTIEIPYSLKEVSIFIISFYGFLIPLGMAFLIYKAFFVKRVLDINREIIQEKLFGVVLKEIKFSNVSLSLSEKRSNHGYFLAYEISFMDKENGNKIPMYILRNRELLQNMMKLLGNYFNERFFFDK